MKPDFARPFRRSAAALALCAIAALPIGAQIQQQLDGPLACIQHYDLNTKETRFWLAQVNSVGSLQITSVVAPMGLSITTTTPPLQDLDGQPFPNGVICEPTGASHATQSWRAAYAQPILLAEDSNTTDLFCAINPDPNNTAQEYIAYLRFNGNVWEAGGIAPNVNPSITGFGAFTWDAVPEWAGEEAFAVFRDTNPTPTIAVVEMLPGTSPYWYVLGGVHPPTGATGWDGNVSACLSTNTVDPAPDAPKLLWISLSCDQGVYVGCAKFGAVNSAGVGRATQDSDFKWTLLTPSPYGVLKGRSRTNMPAHSLHLGADGCVYLTCLEAATAGPGADIYKVTGGPTQGVTMTWDGVRNVDTARTPLESPGSYAAAPWICYSYGSPTTGAGNAVTVPVYRYLVWRRVADFGTANAPVQGAGKPIGAAQRIPIAQITHSSSMQGALVGIIDGPPPVPNENIKNGPGNLADFGHTRYGQTLGQSTDTNYETSVELIAKAKAKAGGLITSVSTEAELDLGGSVKWGNSKETSLLTTYQTQALPVNEDGTWKLLRNGTAFVWESSYTGFTYQFADPSGSVVPDAPQYLQLIPVDSKITAYPFAYDPNATSGIIPGELQTYLMPITDRQNLELNSAYNFKNSKYGSGSIYYAWAEGGSTGEEFDTIKSHYLGGGVDVNFELLLGGEVNAGFFDGKVQAGFDIKFNWDTNTTDSDRNQLGTEVDFPAAPEAPGVYQRYGYHMVNLKENNAYCQELLNRLNSYHDPAGNNANLAKRILPSSAPWKITYAIDQNGDGTGDFYQIPSTLGATAAQVAPIPASLIAKGITTHKQIAQLHGALLQTANPTATGRPGALPADVQAKFASLSPQERSDLANYVKGQQAESRKQFQARHPNWKPRTFPDPKTNLPSFDGKRPAKGKAAPGTPTPGLSPKWHPATGIRIKR